MSDTIRFRSRRRDRRSRKGAMLVLVTLAMVILIAAAAFSTDLAYMFLVREQLHVATDAACKAAVTQLAAGTSTANQALAKQMAVAYASYNMVGGKPLTITTDNVTLGGVTYTTGGKWTFNSASSVNPKTSAQVTAQTQVPLFFAKVLGTSVFNPTSTSTSAFVRNKWCLVFDRSDSMRWDMSGRGSQYPTGTATVTIKTYNWWTRSYVTTTKTISDWSADDSPPHPTLSRWAVLQSADVLFLAAIATSPVENQLGLVTFGDNATTDCTFSSTTYQPITDALVNYAESWTRENTNLKDGLQHALNLFTATDDGTPWNKIIIVLSDGQYNTGGNPLDLDTTLKSQGIIVHTIGLLSGGNNATMQSLADQTGGLALQASNATDLQNAFNKITQTIPVKLTQ